MTGFPYCVQAFAIRRDVYDLAGHLLSHEMAYGVTSMDAREASPAQIAGYVRGHWGIENKIHWVRDVVYGEDHQHAYTAGVQAMAMIRNLAIGLIRLAGITDVKRTLERIAANRLLILELFAASNPRSQRVTQL